MICFTHKVSGREFLFHHHRITAYIRGDTLVNKRTEIQQPLLLINVPGEVIMACMGIGFPVIPGPNMCLFCMAVADTICEDDIVDILARTLSFAA